MKKENCKVTETTVNGTTLAGGFPSREEARAFLASKAKAIRSRSTGERYSLTITGETPDSLTVGVIEGNTEAIKYQIV